MFEKLHDELATMREFLARIVYSLGAGVLLIVMAELVGMIGYHSLEGMSWVDAFLNASMILSGMGPMSALHTNAGKIFAGLYALFSGLIFIAIIGIIFAPMIHRFFHQMHVDAKKAQHTNKPVS
jgi:hypothetical protein